MYQMHPELLRVENLTIAFRTNNALLPAVHQIQFSIREQETLAIVGESGCGKSITSFSIMNLLPPAIAKVTGSVFYRGKQINTLQENEMSNIRGKDISMIFQEPMTSLNPVQTIGKQIGEVLKNHTKLKSTERKAKTIEVLKKVGIPRAEKIIHEYPHQLSGGMRQRVMIAMAIACQPDLLIADEPTTALDVTIQAQILYLMNELKQQMGTSILLITHDLGVVAEMADRVLVMYYGQIVEEAAVESIFAEPKHPYTQGLLNSKPSLETKRQRLEPIVGSVPVLGEVKIGCPFLQRCQKAFDKCQTENPPLINTGNQLVRCWLYTDEEVVI